MNVLNAAKIASLLCAAMLPWATQAQFYYATNDDGTITITGLPLSSYGTIVVPSTINGRTVTRIGVDAFGGSDIGHVIIPDSVTSIGQSAFQSCSSLIDVSIGNGLTNIEDFAFILCSSLAKVLIQGNAPATGGTSVFNGDTNATVYYTFGTTGWGPKFCRVPTVLWNPPGYSYTTNNAPITITGYSGSGGSVVVPASIEGLPVTCIGSGAFYQCTSLTYITLPNTVTNISDSAFSGCSNLTDVVIPSSVGSVGDFVFADCTSLAGVYFQGNAPTVGSDVYFGDTNATVYYLLGTTGWNATFGGLQTVQLSVPYSYTNNSGTIWITGYIGSGGEATIPSTINGLLVTAIVSNAFYQCTNLTSVTVPDSVTSIGTNAFSQCTGLTNVTISSSVTNVGDNAFSGCSNLTSVTLSTNLDSIGNGLFSGCSELTKVIIPGSVANIGSNAFYRCTSLTSITIPNSVTNIGVSAFGVCIKLSSVTIPSSITSIGIGTFGGCSGLTNITIPSSVTTIGSSAFAYCTSLTAIVIPSGVTDIGYGTFWLCVNLKSVYFYGNAPNIGSSLFFGSNRSTVYYLPGTTGWGATFGGRPTAMWKPQIQFNDGSFGMQSNEFGFNINWASNMVVVVEASSNLANPSWTPILTNSLTNGLSYFSDPAWTNYSARLYRVRSQ